MDIHYDPLSKFKDASTIQLTYLCEFIAKQSLEAEINGVLLKEVINIHYGYPTHEFTGGVMKLDGTYMYPEDPDLYPLCHISTVDEDIYMYEYEMVGMRHKESGETYVTRVD